MYVVIFEVLIFVGGKFERIFHNFIFKFISYPSYRMYYRGGEHGGAEGAIAPPLCKGGAEPLYFLLCLIGYY